MEKLTFQDIEQKAREMKARSVNTNPCFAVMDTKIWAGYWYLERVSKARSIFFRWLGRKLHSRRIYWLGFPIHWISGMKMGRMSIQNALVEDGIMGVSEKYMKLSCSRRMSGLPFGELCQYCLSVDSAELSITGHRVCSKCGAGMEKPLAMLMGVPVYDPVDFAILAEYLAWL